MATKTFKGRIQNKHDTEANWNAAVNFKPLAGELIIYDEDNAHSTPRFKVGDGNTLVSNLPFVNGSMEFGVDSFSYEDYAGNIGTFGPMSIELEDSTYKAVYDTTSIGYKNISTDVAYDLKFPTKSGTFAVTSDIDVTAAGNNTFTGSNKFTQKPTFNSGIYLGFTAVAPEVNDLWGIDKEGFKAAGKTILAQTIKFPDFSNFGTTTHTIPLNDTDNTFTGSNKFTQKPRFNSGFQLGFTASAPEVNDLWEIDKEGFKVAGSSLSTQTIKFPDLSTFFTANHTIPLNDTDNTFTGTNTFKTETSDALYRTLIDQNGISVGGGPSSLGILYSTTYGYDRIKYSTSDTTYTYNFPSANGTFVLTSADNNFSGTNIFYKTIAVAPQGVTTETTTGPFVQYGYDSIVYKSAATSTENGTKKTYSFPTASGTLALTSDIPVANSGTGTTALTSLKIGDTIYTIPSGDVTAAGNNTFTGISNTFTNQVDLQGLVRIGKGNSITILSSTSTGLINVKLPSKAGTLALTSDLPVANSGTGTTALTSLKIGDTIYSIPSGGGSGDVTAAGNNTFTGTNTFQTETSGNLYRTLINQNGVSVGGGPGSIVLDITYGFDNIKRLYGDTTYTYTFPNKNGIFATMNDIPNVAPLAKLAQDNTFTALNTFNGGLKIPTTSTFNYGSKEESGVWFSVNEKADVVGVESSASRTQSVSGKSGNIMVDERGYIATGSFTPEGANPRDLSITVISGSSGEVSYNAAQDKIIWTVFTTSGNTSVRASVNYTSNNLITACAIVSHPKGSANTEYLAALPDKSGTLALTNDIPAVKMGFFPIGYIYITRSSTSPAGTFGGTWERIKDKFLLAAGNTYSAGSTGGEATHTLTIGEMPNHSHDYLGTIAAQPGGSTYAETIGYGSSASGGTPMTPRYTGGGSAHNNMPPYLAVYIWKRVA